MEGVLNSGFYVLVIPSRDFEGNITFLNLKLSNQLDIPVAYECLFDTRYRDEKRLSNIISPFETVQIEGFRWSELNDEPILEINIELEWNGEEIFADKLLKFKAKQFFSKTKSIAWLNADGFLFEVFIPKEKCIQKKETASEDVAEIDSDLLKALWLGGNSVSDKIIHVEHAPAIIDLHIEKININYESLPANEKLDIQLREFENKMERAIAKGNHSLVVIHGKGVGRLKSEIIKICKNHPRVKSFGEPLVNKYDSGATEIYFK